MGIFAEQIELVNRTSQPLSVRYDGQDMTLKPNYNADGTERKDVRNMVPKQVVPYAKNQNVLMGSEDAIDPSEFQSLVGVRVEKGAKQKDEITFLEQSKEPTRIPLSELLDPGDKVIQGRGKFKASEAAVAMPGGGGIASQSAD